MARKALAAQQAFASDPLRMYMKTTRARRAGTKARKVILVNKPKPVRIASRRPCFHPPDWINRRDCQTTRAPRKIASVSFDTYKVNITNCGRKQTTTKL